VTTADDDSRFRMHRLGVVMRADLGDPMERLGVLNPGFARDSAGDAYLFPRVVAEGNYSRIARARVLYDDSGCPTGVERLGIVLEPTAAWEGDTETAGVEDPRITRLDDLGVWAMTYTAYGPLGPKIGMATSTDLITWARRGPVAFDYEPRYHTDFNLYPNKDAVLFPEPVTAPDGRPAYALLHRPSFDLWAIRPAAGTVVPQGVAETRQSIWVSYAPVAEVAGRPDRLPRFGQHRFVAGPKESWENVKIGAGPAPVRTRDGWLLLYHGVEGQLSYDWPQPGVRYAAGAMLLDGDDVTKVLWRGTRPLLEPEAAEEMRGLVPHVVFPTAVDVRADGTADVYFGMADDKIGVARLTPTPRD
jgi:predicted GH43/DUF377 family glycosyl hydrolase